MLDPAIAAFFSERKEGWLKKKMKAGIEASEEAAIRQECEELFGLENWLPRAAKRIQQISISTHPCTFSHPSSRKNKNGYVTAIIAKAPWEADGYLRTGNTPAELDALGNAAVLDVFKFLSIMTDNGMTVIDHIRQDTEWAKALLNIKAESHENLRNDFISILSSNETMITSSKIKQVYFPIGDDYHLLSILHNSSLIFKLRDRIDALRFSDTVKKGRELRRSNSYHESGFKEIYNIVTIGYGGTKPQNISVLNNQYGGKSHLLLSIPPLLEQHEVKFPTQDFFRQTLRFSDCKEILQRLDNVFKIERDGVISLEKIRKGRDRCLGELLDVILQKMMALREVSANQFREESSKLLAWQKIWLCEQYTKERTDDWLDTLCDKIVTWIENAYRNAIKHSILLGEAERQYIKTYIDENREVLR
ncbi:type I-F CRISPR-associated protein Csy1 [Legionella taurinensis]|uniref:Type I-F CRISPR-associated protein Csy1 n=1 Tax=Legionella taurinensis TaxID=70611 RepID=A0A3A5L9L8_9GAMM|nr:type I-F CRISPR-associated protein Csy1 [Legionella taurinensis]RJT47790.1 type I-F CRISPR-associated protein Csy1 [Legionella taurinensis]RJT67803.1 type I-F CRISPR-associated protein Csy1 [Legionella taurinensis]STY25779.1 CRISPR type I-F/YPEST-associated protein Csy1 [Legionella taurinensis]